MDQVLNRGGMVVGPSHAEGGVPFMLQDTGRHIEEEGMEINIPRELSESPKKYSFRGTNARVLDQILKLAGLSVTDKVTNVRSGDIIICVRSAWDQKKRAFTGTIKEILHEINTSGGCKPIISPKPQAPSSKPQGTAKNGGTIPKGVKPRVKDWQAEDPNSPRWKKKKQRIEELSNGIHKLRLNVSRDIQSPDERTALTALIVAVMDRTAERIGNDDSADNGHFGVTGFRKKHISVVGSTVHLDYVGKSGTKHEKSFTDARIAKALKKAIKNAHGKFIFETSDGFRVKSDKVNRYLQQFNISAKDMRGYNANRWIIELLKKADGKWQQVDVEKQPKERKKIFNKAVKETAIRVGHGSGTLKKHYMIPELPIQYIEHGRIIDMKNLGYYLEGGELAKGIEVEKEHRNLFLKLKKRLAAQGVEMPITEQDFYKEIAKAHIKERKDYYDLLEKYVEKYTMAEGGPTASIEEKIAERLQERQKTKEFKDTGIATYTRKYRAAYDIITYSDLVDIEKDNVTAYKLIEKSKIWPLYNVNELREQGNSSGAAYMKVKCREFLSSRPLDNKDARAVYVKNVEKLKAGLEPLKTVQDVTAYLKDFVDLDKFDFGDISSFKPSYYIESAYKGNLAKYNYRQVEEYFNDIFGKRFYNFCLIKSDPSKIIFSEAALYQAYTKEQRQREVERRYIAMQMRNKAYITLLEKVEAAPDEPQELAKALKDQNLYFGPLKKTEIIEYINKRLPFTTLSKEQIDKELSKAYTVREDDWSWFGAEKKEAAPKEDEEGKPRKPQNIFEKYGLDAPKIVKRTPLEFIKRTGGLQVGDVSTKAVLENYGFKNVIYGNYVNDVESKEHTRHILGAMLDLVELCNISIKDINKLGGLDINIGATGCGSFSSAMACYFPSLKAINLTKKRGDGSLGHEWAHYLDNVLAEGAEKRATNIQWATSAEKQPLRSTRVAMLLAEYKNWLMTGGTPRNEKVVFYPQKKFQFRIFGDTLPEAIAGIQSRYKAYADYKNSISNDLIRYYGFLAYKLNNNQPLEVELKTSATTFWTNSSRYIPVDYYTDPQELFARAFEGWLEYKLQTLGRSSTYLVDTSYALGMFSNLIPRKEWPYPFREELVWLNDWFERLFSAIRVDYGIQPFTWGTTERVDEYTDYKPVANEKVAAGVAVSSDGTVNVTGPDTEEFEKGYGFRIDSLKDPKGENRNIYRLITNPYSRGKGFAVGGTQSDVFIFALKYFTDKKTGYGIADGMKGELPNIMKTAVDAKLEDAKREAIDYYKDYKEQKKSKPMQQESGQVEMFETGGIIGMPEGKLTAEKVKQFFEGDLPSKIPAEKQKIDLSSASDTFDNLPFKSLNIKPIPYKVRPMDEPLKNLVGTDDLRAKLTGIYYDAANKQKVATDAHVMAIIKDDSIKESKIVNPNTGEVINDQYVNYTAVIPENNPNKIPLTGAQVDSLLNELNGIARAKRFLNSRSESRIVARIAINGEQIFVNPVLLMIVIKALKQYGAPSIDIEFSTPNRGILIVDSRRNGNKGLVMPVMMKDNYLYVDVLQNAPAASSPAPAPVAVPEKKTIERKATEKTDRKPTVSLHECAVRLGRKGGKASAKARAKMGEGGTIEESDITAGARFKNEDGTIFIIDKVYLDPLFGTAVESSLEGGEKGNYMDSIKEVAAFLNEEGAVKLREGGPVEDTDPHDGSDVSEDSTEYLIDMELKPLIDKVRKMAFMPDYQAGVSDADVLGLIVSKYNRWDGDKIKETCVSAFEDANYRDAAEQVSKFAEGGSIKSCGCFSSYLKTKHPDISNRLMQENVNSNPSLRSMVNKAYKAWQGGKLK